MAAAEPAARLLRSDWSTGPSDGPTPPADRWPAIAQWVAGFTLFLIGMRQSVHAGLTTGYILAALLAPLWLPILRRYRGARLLMAVGALSAVAGYALSRYSYYTNTVVSSFLNSSLALLLGTLASIAVVLWAREILPRYLIGVAYALGMLAGIVLESTPNQGNAWKFLYAMPVAIVVLSLCHRSSRSRRLEIPVLLLLALVSVLFDSRSYFATFLLSALLVLWQIRPRPAGGRGSPLVTAGLMAGIASALYYLGTTLLVDGYLGADAQARSIAQIQTAGSLIIGGRPELQATIALFKDRPLGFGMGVIANSNDVLVAKTGLNSIHYAPNNGYVDKFMFGHQIELHSIIGDLWAQCGLMGIALVLLLAALVLRGIAVMVADSTASGLVLLLGFWTLWNLLFSPFFAAAPTLTLALGLVLLRRPEPAQVGGEVALRPYSAKV